MVPKLLGRQEAGELLAATTSGSLEVLGALEGRPLLTVDLDGPGAETLRVPVGLPVVVIGVSRRGNADPSGVDIALAGVERPRPWVTGADLDRCLDEVAAAVATSPVASVTLAQVLRAGEGASLEDALVVESLAYATLQAGAKHRSWLASRHANPVAGSGCAVAVTREGSVVTLTLDRPTRHNAFSAEVRDALADQLAAVAVDPAVTEVHLRGEGPSFCSGGDLDEFGTTPDPAMAHLVRSARSCARLLAALRIPVTAHLHGHCIGAGIELAAFATHVRAEGDTSICLPELRLGLIPGAGGTASLPHRIGAARTAWLAITGAPIDAPTALDWGLVDELT